MHATGLILQPTYRVARGRPVVQLFGRLDDGRAFVITDDRFRPYLFVDASDRTRLPAELAARAEPTELRSLTGEPVLRLVFETPGDVAEQRERLKRVGCRVHEADIRFASRFLIDHGLGAGVAIEGAATQADPGPVEAGGAPLARFHNPTLQPASSKPSLRVVSLDIETTGDASRILSVALAGDGVDEVHLVVSEAYEGETPGRARDGSALFWHADERALLAALAERLRVHDVDVITGWNVADFDWRVIARRCEALRLDPEFGRVPGAVRLRRDPGFMRQWRAEIPGRLVLDGLPLAREALRLDDYRLETVARHVLGRGKRISEHGEAKVDEIQRLAREDPLALAAYNLEDARLVREILDAEGLLALCLERSLLSGMPLDRVGASIASFDQLYLGPLRRCGFVAPCVDRERKTEGLRGGAVLDSRPGLFENVAVFDFKSLYPSLIRTFQLDPLAHALAAGDPLAHASAAGDPLAHAPAAGDPLAAGDRHAHGRSERASPSAGLAEGGVPFLTAPNGAGFAREGAILPGLIEEFMRGRDEAKSRRDRHADQAIKIMMNALYGVLGSASCRFFDPAVANAITGFGQQTLNWTREAFEALGVEVIYGDTDSVFVQLDARGRGKAVQEEAQRLRERVDREIAARIEREYRLESRLTLELERVYDRFFMPRVRGGGGGSKKRYAGWIGDELDLVGLEAVRRDWPELAGRLQRGILEHLFTDRDPLPFVRELVEQMHAGALDRELVYVKRLRKGSLDRYTATTPPHVQAARKAGATTGDVIRYVITRTGPEPVDPDVEYDPSVVVPGPIDRRHYIERVLRPVADAILREAGASFGQAIGEPQQLDLL